MYEIILAFITALTVSYFTIPSIIRISHEKSLMAQMGERHVHKERTPSLGGVGMFAGVLFSVIMWAPFNAIGELQYVLCSFIILFFIGLRDDLIPMTARKKLLGQIIAALILVQKADVRIDSFYGVFGMGEIPELWSAIISVFVIVLIVNAFNLIDGINGLSGCVAILVCTVFGMWFFLNGHIDLAIFAAATTAATLAFLKYNFNGKIFMGDTGSLLIGLVAAVLTIKFLELNDELAHNAPYRVMAAPAMAVALLIFPLFDTLRVFTMRVLRGKSPFSPDRNHLHHLLLDTGRTHEQATAIIVLSSFLVLSVIYQLQSWGSTTLIFLTIGLAVALAGTLTLVRRRIFAQRALEVEQS